MQNCEKCGATWNSVNEVEKCPFCGADLAAKKEPESMEEIFSALVEEHSRAVFTSPEEFLELLETYIPADGKEFKFVKMALKARVYEELYDASWISSEELQEVAKKCIHELQDTFFMEKEWAEKVVGWCQYALQKDIDFFEDDELSEAEELLKKAFDYLGPWCTEEDCYEKGRAYIKQAAELGLAEAQLYMGYYCRDDAEASDYEEAFQWFLKAAEQDDKKAQYELAGMYYEGKGVDENKREAARLYKELEKQGYELTKEQMRVVKFWGR